MKTYGSLQDWLNEVQDQIPTEVMPWVKEAWRLATEAERDACAKVVDGFAGLHGLSITHTCWVSDAIRARD